MESAQMQIATRGNHNKSSFCTEATHLFYMLKDHPSQDEDKQKAKLICQTIKLELD